METQQVEGRTRTSRARILLGERIRAARRGRFERMPLEKFGEEVARLLGRARPFSNVTVSNWETGRQEPSWEALVAIARFAELPLDYFAGVGELADYPARGASELRQNGLDPRMQSVLNAVQRFDSQQQELVARQLANLVETLAERTS
jgi:transcriptional regulator with XRE-family HTH domain